MTVRIILQAVEGLPVHRRVWHRLLVGMKLRRPTGDYTTAIPGTLRLW